jgi:hypothetical protein
MLYVASLPYCWLRVAPNSLTRSAGRSKFGPECSKSYPNRLTMLNVDGLSHREGGGDNCHGYKFIDISYNGLIHGDPVVANVLSAIVSMPRSRKTRPRNYF